MSCETSRDWTEWEIWWSELESENVWMRNLDRVGNLRSPSAGRNKVQFPRAGRNQVHLKRFTKIVSAEDH